MLGALIVAFVIIVVLPSSFMMGGMLIAAVMGWALKDNGEATHEGSELIELNR